MNDLFIKGVLFEWNKISRGSYLRGIEALRDVNFEIEERRVRATATVTSVGRTGVEMEALTGVAVALLNVWDMVKYLEKDKTGNYPHTEIEVIRVIRKEKLV